MQPAWDLNAHIWSIVRQAVAPLEQAISDGTVAVVSGNKAAVLLPGNTEATPGFTIAPGVEVAAGDHVLVYHLGGFQLIFGVLNRTAVVAGDHSHLTMPATSTTIDADQDDYAPSIDDSGVLRVEVLTATRNISGFDATVLTPGRFLWLAPDTNDLVLLDNDALSAAGNRITAPDGTDYTIPVGGGALVMNLDDGDAPMRVLYGASGGAGGGAPTTATYLVGTADGTLSNEIVVGATPGGELGGTWASPTVDATHAGSAHHAQSHNHSAAGDGTALAPASVAATGAVSAGGTLTAAAAVVHSSIIYPTISGAVNNYSPAGMATASTVAITVSGGPHNITGFAAADWTEGEIKTFAVAVGDVVLLNSSGSSSIGNRISVVGSPRTVAAGGGFTVQYLPTLNSTLPFRVIGIQA